MDPQEGAAAGRPIDNRQRRGGAGPHGRCVRGRLRKRRPRSNHLTIVAKGKHYPTFHFKVRGGASTIRHGGTLSIINRTGDAHTFSLITKKVRPTTNKAQRQCYNKHHICQKIFGWHGASGNSPPTKPLVDVGKKGWDREGNLHRKGDSVVFGPGQNPKPAKVSAGNEATLYFICAIHPFMHGKIHVEG